MLLCAPAGNDILFDESLCEQGRNFNNKIWNALRLVKGWQVADIEQPESARLALEWFGERLKATQAEINDHFTKYRLSEALMTVYKLFWDEFSAWLLEMVKPAYGQPIDSKSYASIIDYFEQLTLLLHPFMPFITEEIWHALKDRQEGESIMVTQQAASSDANQALLNDFEGVKQVVAGVRTIRLERNIPQKEALALHIYNGEHNANYNSVIAKMCNLTEIVTAEKDPTAATFMVSTTEYAVPMKDKINVEEEIAKMEEKIRYFEGFLAGVMKKLGNERFVANAKPEIVELERKKKADAESKIETLRASIEQLKGSASK